MWSLISWRNNPDLNLNNELQTLIEKMEQLGSKADDIQCQVRNEELQPRKKRKSEVTIWLKQVEEIQKEFESIKVECLPSDGIRVHRTFRELLKEMKGMMEHVDQLLKQGEFTQGLVLNVVKPEGINLVTTKLVGSTPLTVKDEVWSAFTRGESRVGIFGMGGVGKTTMAIHVNNEILSSCWDCFNHVFYVTVWYGSTVHKLQEDISKALTLTLNSQDEVRRAAELHMSLKKREKSLLILDDIWDDIPMEKVGVAIEGDGCKLLITTRKRDVCRKMSCDTIVEIKPLPENEAWDLFVSKLGNYESLNDAIKCVARSVVEKCAGLPLAIVIMACSMRGEFNVRSWRYVLRQLQNPSSNHNDMDNRVFNILKLSYERLSNDKFRQCLLYCALFHQNYRMSIKDFIAVALLRNEDTRKENRDEGHHMLKALADASLLECTNLKMHDLIRNMAVKIIGSKGIVKPGKGMWEMPRKEEWTQDLDLVSLMSNCIEDIGDELCPECPNLSVLILRDNPLRNIPLSFFLHMKGLRCLDLSYTSIAKLPYSISNLCNLDALLLEGCRNLVFIPSVEKLTKLRDLNLSGTSVEALPEGVKELISLKYLDITETRILSIPEGLLCKLCKLESFLSDYRGKIYSAPKELMSLRQLLRFQGKTDDFKAFKQFVSSDRFDRLERYSVVVGEPNPYPRLYRGTHEEDFFSYSQFKRRILICDQYHDYEDDSNDESYDVELLKEKEVGFKVPHSIQFLELRWFRFGAECLLDALPSLSAATELEFCVLKSCKGIKYIIPDPASERGEYQVSTISKGKGVRRLDLMQLDDFVGLYEGEAVQPHIFFDGLRELRMEGCPTVKRIWLQNDILPNLESIKVLDCKSMEEVFATTQGATIGLTCLKRIDLCALSELKSICENNVFCPYLERVSVDCCPKLEKLWSERDELPRLEHISVVECDQMKEIIEITDETATIRWPELCSLNLERLPELKRICRNTVLCPQLEDLRVRLCPKLKKLSFLNDSMQSLRQIQIGECREMEQVFEARDADIHLPNLERMTLKELPELRSICGNGNITIVCNFLKRVTVKGENKLVNCPISVPRLLFPTTSPPFPTLKAWDKPKDWWNTLCWNDPATKLAFDRLGCLHVMSNFGAQN